MVSLNTNETNTAGRKRSKELGNAGGLTENVGQTSWKRHRCTQLTQRQDTPTAGAIFLGQEIIFLFVFQRVAFDRVGTPPAQPPPTVPRQTAKGIATEPVRAERGRADSKRCPQGKEARVLFSSSLDRAGNVPRLTA